MPPKRRRRWSTDEENILLGALKGIVIAGWKVDNKQSRLGYLQKLQEVMLSFLPQSDLRAKPHIDSKITHWRKLYHAVTDMLRTTGFSWNDIDKVVEFESADVWDAYCMRAGEFTRRLKNKPFPYYEDWILIFGNDRATSELVEGPTDTLEAFERRDDYNGQSAFTSMFDCECSGSPFVQPRRPIKISTSTLSGKKLSRNGDALVEAVVGMTEKVDNALHISNVTLQCVGSRLGYAHDFSTSRRQVNDILLKLPLDQNERLQAGHAIVHDQEKVDYFMSLSDDDKLQYIYLLLTGKLQKL